jgi:predicted MFS family arabinose efflux permease
MAGFIPIVTEPIPTGEEAVDIAIPISATFWNLAIAAGGVVGGVLLNVTGAQSIPWTLFVVVLVALVVSWGAKKHGFRVV